MSANENATEEPEESDPLGILADLARDEVSLEQRLIDAERNPGAAVTFDPDEAEELGFFIEDALTPEDAEDSAIDNPNTARREKPDA